MIELWFRVIIKQVDFDVTLLRHYLDIEMMKQTTYFLLSVKFVEWEKI